jgi:regulator of sigma E protease
LQPGDRIVRLDGIENPTWEQIGPRIMLSANQPLDITVQRGGQTFQKTLVPEPVTTSEVGSAGWEPNQAIVVADLEAGMPAEKAGIKDGDEIVALDGKPVPAIDALIESLQQTKDKPVDVGVLREGRKLDFPLKPVLAEDSEDRTERYRIGFQGTTQMKVGNLSFVPALRRSLDDNKKLSLMILELVQKLVQRKVSLRTVEGPIGIGRAAGQAASEKGWTPLLELTAAISLNLGIFNLLPIPILDGGVILLLAVEGLMGRDISLNIKERIYQAAFVFLVLFAVMVIYNDLAKTLPGMMQRLP